MKHKMLSVLLFLVILSGLSLFAEASPSDFYVKTIYIVRVYSDSLGFRVDYQTSNMELRTVYMPTEWFGKAGGYGEIIYGNHPSAPYMSIWYKEGKIDHFRLNVKKDFQDPSWGSPHLQKFKEEDFNMDELSLIY